MEIFYPELIQLNRKSPEIYRAAVGSANEADHLSLEFRLDSWGDSSRRTVFDRRRQYLRKPIMNRGGRDDLKVSCCLATSFD